MDPVTQAALGSVCSLAILYPKTKHNAWIVGGLAGMVADLDIFIRSSQDPMLFFVYHRHFTHSLIFIPIGALLVTLCLLLFKRFRVHWQLTYLAALIGYATHGLLDACTHYGTLLFWPFSNERVSWNIVSIIDPWVTISLCLGIVYTLIFNTKKGVWLSLLFVGALMAFNLFQKERAIAVIEEETKIPLTRLDVFPKLASSRAWRGIAIYQKQLKLFDVSTPLFQKARITFQHNYSLYLPEMLPAYVKRSPTLSNDFHRFNWFGDNYLILTKKQPLTLGDGRFIAENNPRVVLWGIQFEPNQQHVSVLHHIDNHEF